MSKKTIYWIVGIVLFLWYFSCKKSISNCSTANMFGGFCKLPVKLSGCVYTDPIG